MPSIAQLRQLAHILLLRARKELDEGDDDASEDHRMLACVIWGRMLQLRRRERGMASLSPRERRLRLLAQDKVSSSWEALRMTGTTFPKIVALAARDPPTRQKLDRWIYGGEPDQRAKKGKKAETGLASDDDEPEEENDDDDILAQVVEEEEAELRADCVVDFICNAAADDFQDDDDDDDHDADDRLSPARHFEFFSRLRHRKEMWAELVSYCSGFCVTLSIPQAQEIWQWQHGTYTQCKKADEGASGANAEIGEYEKADFEATARYRWLDRVTTVAAPNAPRPLLSNQAGHTRSASTAFSSDDDDEMSPSDDDDEMSPSDDDDEMTSSDDDGEISPSEHCKAAQKRRKTDQDRRAAARAREIANAKKAEAADKQSYDAQYKMIRDLEDCDRVARNRARIAEFLVGRTDTPEDVKRKAKEILAERTRDAIRVVEGFR